MSSALARGLLCGLLLAALAPWPTEARAAASLVEYVDTEYGFAFQCPAGWERQRLPVPGEAGKVRVAVKNIVKPVFVLAIVTPMGKTTTREQFERSPANPSLC
jgi:hypothetical protein